MEAPAGWTHRSEGALGFGKREDKEDPPNSELTDVSAEPGAKLKVKESPEKRAASSKPCLRITSKVKETHS